MGLRQEGLAFSTVCAKSKGSLSPNQISVINSKRINSSSKETDL